MKLRSRLLLITGAITMASTFAVGAFGADLAFRSELNRADLSIKSVFDAASTTNKDAVAAAVEDAMLRTIQVTVGLIDNGNEIVTLQGDDSLISTAPPATQMVLAEKRAVTIDAVHDYRLRSVSIENGSHILIAVDISAIQSARDANLALMFGFGLIAMLVALVLLWIAIRLDLKIVERLATAAQKISSGEREVHLPRAKGKSEVATLARALNEMIRSLESALEKEKSTQKAMQNFMGDASHELRTPLTVIKGYAELLATQGSKKDFRDKAVGRVRLEVERMEQLISDLLLLAELGETKDRDITEVNLSEMVSRAITDLASLDSKRKVEADIDTEVSVAGSEDQLQQLVNNVVSNIRRHTPKSAPVKASLKTSGKKVVLTFEDGGAGLSEDAYRRGIESFERFDAFASRQNGGSGLGMTIMRTIVRNHEGKIKLSASPELGGLRTEIQLPR
jgi:signal transduction histidine kinase